ncbi:MAG: response regulator [Candidatus Delongbacteria bacterium]|nr:response regulator [Candidatus Delongbacteria bacterium]
MKILIVDDKYENRYMLEVLLKAQGYTTISAENGKEALDKLNSNIIDLIISDILMPVMDGFQLCRICKDDLNLKNIPFVIFTATYVDEKDEIFGYEIGADLFIRKPIDPQSFTNKIKELFDKYFNNNLELRKPLNRSDEETFKLYSERLVNKLEKKMLDLEVSEARYASLVNDVLDTTQVGLFILDKNFKVVWMNKAMELYFDVDREQMIDIDIRVLVVEKFKLIMEEPEEFSRIILKSYNENSIINDFECHVLPSKNREERWLRHLSKPIVSGHFKGGRIEHYYDVSTINEMISKLAQSEKKANTFLEVSADGILTVDTITKKFHFANNAICQMFGYSKEEFLRMTIDDIHPKDSERIIKSEFEEQKSGVKTLARSIPCLRKDGTIFYADINSNLTIVDDKEYLIGFFRDVTEILIAEEEKQKLQEKLQQAQRMEAIGNLAGGIAHDFNNILSAIIGFSQLALKQLPVRENPVRSDLEKILMAGERARNLVKQILSLSRHHQEEVKSTLIQPVLKEVLKLLSATLPATIEIKQNINNDIGPIMADATQIYQVIINLCTNASHAMQDSGGVLDIILESVDLDNNFLSQYPGIREGRFAKLSIKDTGCGISQDVISHIFEPYFTTKANGEGTGLGLAVTYGIIQKYGGLITVESELDKGSQFTIYFPSIDDRDKKEKIDSIPIQGGNENILFVDDEIVIAEMAKRMLENLGYFVQTFSNPVKALEIFNNNPNFFNLVITDMTMPHMTGDVLAEKLISIRDDIPIILCTGFTKQMNWDRAKIIGIKGSIMKPFKIDELAAIIRIVLDDN